MTTKLRKRIGREAGPPSYFTPSPCLAQAKEDCGASDRFLAFALDQHAIVSVTDAHGNISYVNDRFVEISGYSRDELIGQNHRVMKSDEHPPEFYRKLWRTIAQGKTWRGEVMNLRKGGEPYWVTATIVPYLNGQGRPVEYLSILTDITAIKSQDAFKQQQISFDLIRGEVYMFWPSTLRFFYLNRYARARCKGLGLDPHGLSVMDVLGDVPEVELRYRLQRLETKTDSDIIFYRNLDALDGTVFPAEVTVQLVEPTGEQPRFVAVVRDISERKQAAKAKAEFIATVRHELRTPLTSIKGALGLIKAGVTGGTPEKTAKLIDIALNSCKRLETLIKDLLEFEEMETGKLICRLEEVDIARIVADAVNEFSASPNAKGMRIIASGTARPVLAIGDRGKLMQVLANLLSNAVKFSDKDEPIEIGLRTDGTHAFVSVTDHGIGISEADKARIFDSFAQADSSDQRRAGGIGLGLSLVKAIIADHGGSIDLQSELGQGTTFVIGLRLSTPDAAA